MAAVPLVAIASTSNTGLLHYSKNKQGVFMIFVQGKIEIRAVSSSNTIQSEIEFPSFTAEIIQALEIDSPKFSHYIILTYKKLTKNGMYFFNTKTMKFEKEVQFVATEFSSADITGIKMHEIPNSDSIIIASTTNVFVYNLKDNTMTSKLQNTNVGAVITNFKPVSGYLLPKSSIFAIPTGLPAAAATP